MTCPSRSPRFEQQKKFTLGTAYINFVDTASERYSAPRKLWEKVLKLVGTSSEIADRKYIFHITVFEHGMLACPLTKYLDTIIYAQHLEVSSSGNNVH
jgi:hypothetical protein